MDIYIIGAGGHGEVVLDAVRAAGRHGVVGFLDSDPSKHGTEVDGVRVLGAPEEAAGPFVVGIGDNAAREELSRRLGERGLKEVTVVHPTANVASNAALEAGCVICAGAIICAHARLGRAVIVNTGAVVEHHNRIDDYAHIAPGAVLAGRAAVRTGALVGAAATVLPHVTVGTRATVGAGSVVLRDVPDGATVAGVPARRLDRPPSRGGGQRR